MNTSFSPEMSKAFSLIEKGSLSQAKILLENLLKTGEKQAELGLQKINEELMRKYWRQGKVEEMEKIASKKAQIALARLKGEQALRNIKEDPEACPSGKPA